GHRASECQLDHTREWNHTRPTRGGPTSITNLAPLCGRDHQVKTHGDFRLTQTAPGAFEWTTPTGHHYRREPDGTTTMLSHPDHHDTGTVEDADNQPNDGPPPFLWRRTCWSPRATFSISLTSPSRFRAWRQWW